MKKFAIIGAGAGGQTMAAVLASNGYAVNLYDIDREKIEKLKALGKICVTGMFECEGSPQLITDDIEQALENVDIIMITSTANAHGSIALKCKPYLKDGQIIVLNPGQVGGALEVANIVRDEAGGGKDLIIAEASDLMYACRSSEIGHTFQSGIKTSVSVATLPGRDIDRFMEAISPTFPCFKPLKSVLETSFDGGGAMLHPIPSLMNVNKMDVGEQYDFYMQGITKSIASMISACDVERVKVCKGMGVNTYTLVEWLQDTYKLEQNDLYELLQNNKAYRGVKCPTSFTHRFIEEDMLSGMVPLASVGKFLGIDVPMMDAVVEIASVVYGRDFRTEGRTARKLGFEGKSLEEIHQMVR